MGTISNKTKTIPYSGPPDHDLHDRPQRSVSGKQEDNPVAMLVQDRMFHGVDQYVMSFLKVETRRNQGGKSSFGEFQSLQDFRGCRGSQVDCGDSIKNRFHIR